MTTFLLDLWQDLRAKRLWPVAVALLAATVAVPAMLFKPASSAAPSTGAGQASNAGKLPVVTLDASSIAGSHLNIFKEKNPFTALRDPDPDPNAAAANAGNGASGPGSVASTTPTGTGSGSSTGTGSTSGGGSGGTTPPGGSTGKPSVHYFTYTADVRFGPRGDIKDFKSLHELDLLPSGDSPVVAFMGVKDGTTAVFFIADPAFRAEGEGACQPTPENCMFVYLTKDPGHDEETLSAQNGQVEYVLQLTGLHVQTISKSQAVGDATPDKSGNPPAAKRSKKTRVTLLSLPSVRLAKR
jgi:hypothetical protein